MPERVQCCFCGRTIEPTPPDICSLTIQLDWQERADLDEDSPMQQLYCHAACLREHIPKNIPLLHEAQPGHE